MTLITRLPLRLLAVVPAILCAALCAADPAPAGLVAAYDFETIQPPLLPDGSGLNNHGLMTQTLPGRDETGNGNAIFNGTGSCVRVPFSPSLTLSNFTITAWVWSDDEFAVMDRGVFGKHREHNNISYFWLFQHENKIQATMVGRVRDQFEHLTCDARPWIRQWAFVALRFDGTFFSLTVNETLVGVQPVQGYRGNAYDLLIGAGELAQLNNQPQRWWKGRIDAVRVYDRGLSDGELRRLSTARKPLPPAPPAQAHPVPAQQAPVYRETPKPPAAPAAARAPTLDEIRQALGNLSAGQLQSIFKSISPAIQLVPGVTRIAFSNGASPWDDETVFSTDQTLAIHVNDVDLEAAAKKGATVKVVATQGGDPENGLDPYERTIELLPSKDGTFEGTIALNVFVPGTVYISVIGLTPDGTQLFRLSRITIK